MHCVAYLWVMHCFVDFGFVSATMKPAAFPVVLDIANMSAHTNDCRKSGGLTLLVSSSSWVLSKENGCQYRYECEREKSLRRLYTYLKGNDS